MISSTLETMTRRIPSRPHDTATSLSHTDTKLTATAKPTAGHIAAIGEIPAALSAVISLVADIRPNTLATAKSIVPGTANRIASGRTYGTRAAICIIPSPCCWASFTSPTTSMNSVSAESATRNT